MKKYIISVTGLGYVGLPLALAFDKKTEVIGFDMNENKISLYQQGIDPTQEMGDEKILASKIEFTTDVERLKRANFHIITVPTPINDQHQPDLTALRKASETIGSLLKKGDIVVYESTVYPGATEEICIPILEAHSKLKCGVDFKVGYSPERINPADKVHTVETIVKVVSASDIEALEEIAYVYEQIIHAGVHKALSIKVAEAAKVIENTQRDVNIALMNELSNIFHALDVDTYEVLKAANTKWNFLDFKPGLVGGHCISVDPYYLAYRSIEAGYKPELILTGRKVNDSMSDKIVERVIKFMIKHDLNVKDAKVAILGFTFKENSNDIRNTKVYDIIKSLREYGIKPIVCDPIANKSEVSTHYDIALQDYQDLHEVDLAILAVAHDEFIKESEISLTNIFATDKRLVFDVKGAIKNREMYIYESL